jgi:hypothetical protein
MHPYLKQTIYKLITNSEAQKMNVLLNVHPLFVLNMNYDEDRSNVFLLYLSECQMLPLSHTVQTKLLSLIRGYLKKSADNTRLRQPSSLRIAMHVFRFCPCVVHNSIQIRQQYFLFSAATATNACLQRNTKNDETIRSIHRIQAIHKGLSNHDEWQHKLYVGSLSLAINPWRSENRYLGPA